MGALRSRLRAWTLTWFILQAASLSAFVPADCCAGHRATATHDCHEEVAAPICPMRGADGTPCPMHRPPAAAEPARHRTPAGHEGHGTPAHADAPHHTDHSLAHEVEPQHRAASAHAGHAGAHASAPASPADADRCAIGAVCRRPTLFTLMSNPGTLPDATVALLPAAARDVRASGGGDRPLDRVRPPDLRPPKSSTSFAFCN